MKVRSSQRKKLINISKRKRYLNLRKNFQKPGRILSLIDASITKIIKRKKFNFFFYLAKYSVNFPKSRINNAIRNRHKILSPKIRYRNSSINNNKKSEMDFKRKTRKKLKRHYQKFFI